MPDTNKCLHAIIYGIVQGVSFRYYTTRKANEFGLTGWVRNNADGTVEVIAEGTHSMLEQLRTWLHEGSPSAQVERVEASYELASGDFSTFKTVYYQDSN